MSIAIIILIVTTILQILQPSKALGAPVLHLTTESIVKNASGENSPYLVNFPGSYVILKGYAYKVESV